MKRTGKPEMSMIKMDAKRARLLAVKALFRMRRERQNERQQYIAMVRNRWNFWLRPLIWFRLMNPYTNMKIKNDLDANRSIGNLVWNVGMSMPPLSEEYENCHNIWLLARLAQKKGDKKIWLTKADFAALLGAIPEYI